MRRMAVNSAAQILTCIKANTKIRYFVNKALRKFGEHLKKLRLWQLLRLFRALKTSSVLNIST